MEFKKLCALLLILALFPVIPFPVACAAEPLKVEAKVDKTTVRAGDTITVTWTVSGGNKPDLGELIWNVISPVDVYGENGTAKLTVRQGMHPWISFFIDVSDRSGNNARFHSDDLGINIVNLDGWKYGGKAFHIQLDKQAVKRGEPITATVTQQFNIGQGTYVNYTYQWYTGNSHVDEEPKTILREVPWNKYQQTFTFTPKTGNHGFLEVTSDLGSWNGEKTSFYSEYFTILDADTPTCTIKLDKTEVNVGQPLTAEYAMQNHDGSSVVAWWEFREEVDGSSEILDEESVNPTGKKQMTFDRPGTVRFVVDTLYGSFEGKWQEYTPHYTSDWIPVNKVAGIKPLTVSSSLTEGVKCCTVSLPVGISWDIQGGTPPYQVEYALQGRYQGELYMRNASSPITITQAAAGKGNASPILENYPGPYGGIYVKVTDANGLMKENTDSPYFDILEPIYAKATAGDGYVEIRWGTPPNYTDFSIYQYQNDNFTLLEDKVPEGPYRINNLTNGQVYHFLVRLRDYNSYSALHPNFVVSAIPHKPGEKTAGDANGDNTIDILDLVSIIDFIVSDTACTSMLNADANGDGNVDILDLVWIIDTIVGG